MRKRDHRKRGELPVSVIRFNSRHSCVNIISAIMWRSPATTTHSTTLRKIPGNFLSGINTRRICLAPDQSAYFYSMDTRNLISGCVSFIVLAVRKLRAKLVAQFL